MKRWAALGLSLLFLALSPVREVRPAAGTEAVDTTKYIALTFDDGPRPGTTGRLLEELARRGVHATFFLIGRQIPGNEDLIRQMALFGHQIGVHTYDHVLLEGEDEYTVRQQVRQTERLLDRILETEGDWWLRPPYGAMTQREAAWVETPMIQWTIDPEDWRDEDAQRVTEHILERAGPGTVPEDHSLPAELRPDGGTGDGNSPFHARITAERGAGNGGDSGGIVPGILTISAARGRRRFRAPVSPSPAARI